MPVDLEDQYDDSSEENNGTNSRAKKLKHQRKKQICSSCCEPVFFGASVLLFSVAAFRFAIVKHQSVHEVIINLYLLLLGVIISISQLQLVSFERNLRFLNYHWGKALICLFITSTLLSNRQNLLLQYLCAAFFLLMTLTFTMLACYDRVGDINRGLDEDEKEERKSRRL